MFALGLLAIWSPVLGHTSSVGYGFCLVEWALSLIRHQLVAPTSSIPSLSGRIYCSSNVWWLLEASVSKKMWPVGNTEILLLVKRTH